MNKVQKNGRMVSFQTLVLKVEQIFEPTGFQLQEDVVQRMKQIYSEKKNPEVLSIGVQPTIFR